MSRSKRHSKYPSREDHSKYPSREDQRSAQADQRPAAKAKPRKATPSQLAAARATLMDFRWRSHQSTAEPLNLEQLLHELSLDLGFREQHLSGLIYPTGIADPLAQTLSHERIDRFVHTLETAVVRYPGPYPSRDAGEEPARPPTSSREQKLARVRAAFRSHRTDLDELGAHEGVVQPLVDVLTNASGIPGNRVSEALKAAGVDEYSPETLSAASCERFIAEAFHTAPVAPEPWLDLEPPAAPRTPGQLTAVKAAYQDALEAIATAAAQPAPEPAAEQTPAAPPRTENSGSMHTHQIEAARRWLPAIRARLHSPAIRDPTAVELSHYLAHALGRRQDLVRAALAQAGIDDPLALTFTEERFEAFLTLAPTLSRRRKVPKAAHLQQDQSSQAQQPQEPEPEPAPIAVAPTEVTSAPARGPFPGETHLEQTRRLAAHQRSEAQVVTAARLLPEVPPKPATAPKRRTDATPACRALTEGWSTGQAARTTAELYLAVAELTATPANATEQELAEITAERFGIHAAATTAARLHDRADRAVRAGEAGAQLDHLSRLVGRPRGLFYDGHLDRLTLWDNVEGSMLLYTCTGPELRAAAANAVEWGDRRMPTMRRQAIGPSYIPAKAEDPSLILAVAAEQLGRQASVALRHRATTRPQQLVAEENLPPRTTATGKQIRTVSPTWVEPVSGYGDDLVLGKMESSYTRHVEGPRSRAATTVREFYRRAPGTARTASKTVKVSSHRRRGIGPDANAPAVTRVSGRRTMWR